MELFHDREEIEHGCLMRVVRVFSFLSFFPWGLSTVWAKGGKRSISGELRFL